MNTLGMHIAMIGTRGVPARYGGFETAVEEIGSRLVMRGHRVTVYCRNPGQDQTQHLGMRLVNLPALRRKQLETLSHSALSVGHAVVRARPDVALVFNSANAPLLPALKAGRIPTAVHLDGLEWQRAKWAGAGAAYYQRAERLAVRWADALIADARAIGDYVADKYGAESTYLPYGAPIIAPGADRLATLDLAPGCFHLVVSRFEPENHVLEIVRGYAASPARFPLVVVGAAPYADAYTRTVRNAAGNDSRVRFVGPIWDQLLLDQLYANACSYLHGHSVGGTNPSLLRAMGAAAPVTAHDNPFNREVADGHAKLFSDEYGIGTALVQDEQPDDPGRARGIDGQRMCATRFSWESVARGYLGLCERLSANRISTR
jgi:glycosyltransferase involved in cell wall biosynthesis